MGIKVRPKEPELLVSVVRCPHCCRQAWRRFELAHTTVWECTARDCRLQFAAPQLNDDELACAYAKLYYPAGGNGHSPIYENTSDQVLYQIFHRLEDRIGTLPGLRLLDYGCGVGSLLRVAREFGLAPTGIEPALHARSVAAGIQGVAVHASLDELCRARPLVRFDLVILWTVIEHLRHPWADLARVRELLSPGGWLIVSTMNIRCLRARLERQRWDNYENPTHFYYFDPHSLERVLGSAGFTHVEQWKPSIRYPQHGTIRRYIYELLSPFGLADGLFYLCQRQDSPQRESVATEAGPELAGAARAVAGIAATLVDRTKLSQRQ